MQSIPICLLMIPYLASKKNESREPYLQVPWSQDTLNPQSFPTSPYRILNTLPAISASNNWISSARDNPDGMPVVIRMLSSARLPSKLSP